MTPSQVRNRIKALEEKFSRIKEEFFQLTHGQQSAPQRTSEEATSDESGEIREDLTRDR